MADKPRRRDSCFAGIPVPGKTQARPDKAPRKCAKNVKKLLPGAPMMYYNFFVYDMNVNTHNQEVKQ